MTAIVLIDLNNRWKSRSWIATAAGRVTLTGHRGEVGSGQPARPLLAELSANAPGIVRDQ
ncbi:hypothetical protein ACIO93_11320 [Streptomyces sp. NPDC087903]|uniref:hypothetical protein n=1 Tax=Streptomyces sp. NPDC087903 TaxID=3365819 RepID=UPI0037FBE07F